MRMGDTLHDLLRDAADRAADKTFLHADAGTGPIAVDFGSLQERSRRVSAGLISRGLRPGDRVAIAAPNRAEWLELFFGAARIGVITVTLSPRYRSNELEHMLNDSGARLVVTATTDGDTDLVRLHENLRHRTPGVEAVLFLGGAAPRYQDLVADAAGRDVDELENRTSSSTPALILYTSGTTGRPKGAVLTHGSLTGAARAQAEHLKIRECDVHIGATPLNHVAGITCTAITALHAGSSIVLLPRFSPDVALEAIATHRATVMGGVPTMWELMLRGDGPARYDLSSLRTVIVGGSPVSPALCAGIARTLPHARLANLYGLSEVSGACVISAHSDNPSTVGRTLGVPLLDVDTRIVGDDGEPTRPGEEGELHVRSPGAGAGYWNDPEATTQTFIGDGWVATGDIALREPDGHIVLRGRRSDMYIQGGYNVYPTEVEDVMTTHPAVAMAAGIGVPDPVLGQVGHYYLVLHAGSSATVDEVVAHCRQRLADYKVPRQVTVVDDLPLTPAGKINKTTLRSLAASRESEPQR